MKEFSDEEKKRLGLLSLMMFGDMQQQNNSLEDSEYSIAKAYYSLYSKFLGVGFDEEQAFDLLCLTINTIINN